MFNYRWHTLLFLILSLFFCSSPIIYSNLYSKKNKNPRIQEAQLLIRDKKYNEALIILNEELISDDANEDLIMKLIEAVEKEKEKVIGMVYAAKENIKKGDFKKAEEIIVGLEKSGEFDDSVTKMISVISKDRELLNEIVSFNEKVTKEGESYFVNFDIQDTMNSYKSALDVFRNDKSQFVDNEFIRATRLFDVAEKKLFESDINEKLLGKMENPDYNFVSREKDRMNKIVKQWKNIEGDFIRVKDILNNVREITKKSIIYEAYYSITDKYRNLIGRSIQKYGLGLMDYLFSATQNEMNRLGREEGGGVSNIDRLIDLFPEIEKASFYNITINFKDDSLIKRSKMNIVSYLDYITKRNTLIIKAKEMLARNDYNSANDYYTEYLKLKNEKYLFEAEKSIKLADNSMSDLLGKNSAIDAIMLPYSDFNYGEFTQLNNQKRELDEVSLKLKQKIGFAMSEIEKSLAYLKELLNEADKRYDESVNFYNTKLYSKAKENFGVTKDKYYEIVLQMQSDYIDEQIDNIDEYLDKIEQLIFSADIRIAEEYLEKAKIDFYAEKYDEAKSYIDEADKIFIKYNQNRDIIDFYRERILHAIKIQSGKILSIDDQAYEEITELLKNARYSYEQKSYEEALQYINQILLEKPYYEAAKIFEIKLLRETDPESFENVYKNYYDKAVAKYTSRSYEDALIEFQQLLQFRKNLNAIRNYIYQCKVRLNLTKPVVTENDKKRASSIIENAKASYAEGNFQDAYEMVNQALKIWEDVPEAKSIKLACMQKLRIERPKLTKDNELLYREALKAYSENDFERAYQLTTSILRTQDFEEVRRLNKKADVKRKT